MTTTILNFSELAPRIHQNAKAKGFWDKPRNVGEVFMLMVSELSEALEAHRSGRQPNMDAFGTWEFGGSPTERDRMPDIRYKAYIKGSIHEEMADIAIRMMDWCYYNGHTTNPGAVEEEMKWIEPPLNFGEALLALTKSVCSIAEDWDGGQIFSRQSAVTEFWANLHSLCEKRDVDLPLHVELKMKYNETREHMHGKAY